MIKKFTVKTVEHRRLFQIEHYQMASEREKTSEFSVLSELFSFHIVNIGGKKPKLRQRLVFNGRL